MSVSESNIPARPNGGRAARTSLVARINKRAIFEHFLANDRASLRELAESLQMSNPTVRKAVGSLSASGLVEELSEKQQTVTGRPGAVYRLRSERARLIGVSLSTAVVEVVESGLDGAVGDEKRHSFPTPGDYGDLISAIAGTIRNLVSPATRLLAIGVSVPGELDLEEQRVVFSPLLHATDGHFVSRDLESELGIDGVRVAIYKDTTCGCLVERHWGQAYGARNFVVLGVREGFGAGIWLNGQLLGDRGTHAPEVGHITVVDGGEPCACGNRGCLETLATDRAFARRVNNRLGQSWDVATIVQRARRQEIDVAAELSDSVHFLAVGIATIVNLFDPELLCVDTQMLDVAPGAFDDLKAEVERMAFPSRLATCTIQRTAEKIDNSRGALAAALNDLLNRVGPATLHNGAMDL